MAYFMPASAPSFHPAPFPVFGAPQNQSLSGPQVFKQVEILVGQGESFGSLMKRFKRAVSKSGVMQDARRHQHFETTQEKKKRKTATARRFKGGPTPGNFSTNNTN
mmetsp:Transcript_17792/g.30662  ORF Transcript_17792/g.30662 Transcript_17792/m.30662 type:complete len:106 (-) Transcript_17792:610-927(-)